MRYRRVREHLVFQSPWMRVYHDEVIKPDGTLGRYSRVVPVSGLGGAHIVPRLPDGQVLLIRASRYPVDSDVWEFPRGGRDPGESLRDTAVRELKEETGITAEAFVELGTIWPDTGVLSSRHNVFLAELAFDAPSKIRLAGDEGVLEGRFLRPDAVLDLIAAGDIVDGTVLASLMLLRMHDEARRPKDGSIGTDEGGNL